VRKSAAHSANAGGGLRFAHPPYGPTDIHPTTEKGIRE
jgi:hypothetical protein